jgi:hypothetical protein
VLRDIESTGGGGDGKVLVSELDSVSDYLINKLVAGAGITIEKYVPPEGDDLEDNLVAQFFMNEADSGTGPTEVVDQSDNPENLTIRYDGGEPYYTNIYGHGLRWETVGDDGCAYKQIQGSKIASRLQGLKKASYEIVVNAFDAHSSHSRLIHIAQGSDHGRFTLQIDEAGRLRGCVNNLQIGEIYANMFTRGFVAIHMVFDSTQAVAEDRLKVYIDGDHQAWTTTDDTIPLDTTLDLQVTDPDVYFCLGNRYSGNRAADLYINYAAIYDVALTQDQIDDHCLSLPADNDTSPIIPAEPPETPDNETLVISCGSYHYVIDDSESSTDSTDWVTRATLIVDDVPAGNLYEIGWSFIWRSSSTGDDALFRIILDDGGPTVLWEMRKEPSDAGGDQRIPAAGFKPIALAEGSNTLLLQFRSSDSAEDVYIFRSVLKAERKS